MGDDKTIHPLPQTGDPVPEPDHKAEEERQRIADNRYEEDGRRRDHFRLQRFKGVLFPCITVAVAIGVLLLISFIVVWGWHVLVPAGLRWLTVDDVDQIQSILFSGALSATITILGRQVFVRP